MTPTERLRSAATRLRDGGRTLMEEDVALALADWLDAAARDEEAFGQGDRYPLAVADAVLGGEQS